MIKISTDYKETTTVIKEFIKTYVKNSGCNGVVIGLSGGIDSAVTAVICRQALGKNNAKCIFLPEKATPESDDKHQDLLVKNFDLDCGTRNISDIVEQFSKNSLVKSDKCVLANVKARIRMTLLFEYANVHNLLVCGTSNKSEILIGYFTKYGDGGVDFMPLGDLYKTQIWELAKHLKIPDEIIKKPPTAGLWEGQTDEKEFKLTYSQLDTILMGLETKTDEKKIAELAGVKVEDVRRIKNMRLKSQHKRRSPQIPKIGLRTPGFDWRSPVQLG